MPLHHFPRNQSISDKLATKAESLSLDVSATIIEFLLTSHGNLIDALTAATNTTTFLLPNTISAYTKDIADDDNRHNHKSKAKHTEEEEIILGRESSVLDADQNPKVSNDSTSKIKQALKVKDMSGSITVDSVMSALQDALEGAITAQELNKDTEAPSPSSNASLDRKYIKIITSLIQATKGLHLTATRYAAQLHTSDLEKICAIHQMKKVEDKVNELRHNNDILLLEKKTLQENLLDPLTSRVRSLEQARVRS